MTTFHHSRSAFDEVERPAVEHGSLRVKMNDIPRGDEPLRRRWINFKHILMMHPIQH